jgi:hypothetical protein
MAGPNEPSTFFPRGAIASFVGMILFYAVFWFVMYALMTHRS